MALARAYSSAAHTNCTNTHSKPFVFTVQSTKLSTPWWNSILATILGHLMDVNRAAQPCPAVQTRREFKQHRFSGYNSRAGPAARCTLFPRQPLKLSRQFATRECSAVDSPQQRTSLNLNLRTVALMQAHSWQRWHRATTFSHYQRPLSLLQGCVAALRVQLCYSQLECHAHTSAVCSTTLSVGCSPWHYNQPLGYVHWLPIALLNPRRRGTPYCCAALHLRLLVTPTQVTLQTPSLMQRAPHRKAYCSRQCAIGAVCW